MLTNIIKQINWLDIFILIILIRVCYAAIKTGFPAELFKILGVISATYISFHYYTRLSAFISVLLGFKNISLAFLNFISFIFLAGIGLSVFVFLRRVFFKLVKIEAVSSLNKWGGFVLGIARGFLFSSLVVFIVVISGIGYLKKSVTNSYSGRCIFKIAPATYSWVFNGLTSKFINGEKLNQAIHDIEKDVNK